MLKTYRIIPVVFILFLFGFTLITVAPVFAQGQGVHSPMPTSQEPNRVCTEDNLKFIATTNRPLEYKERYVREFFDKCVWRPGEPRGPKGHGAVWGEIETPANKQAKKDACEQVKHHMTVVRPKVGVYWGQGCPEAGCDISQRVVDAAGIMHMSFCNDARGGKGAQAACKRGVRRVTPFATTSDALIFNIVVPVLCGE